MKMRAGNVACPVPPPVGQRSLTYLALLICLTTSGCLYGPAAILPEQRTLSIREIPELPRARIPDIPPPPTVADPQPDAVVRHLSLDEAIHIALVNSKVIRVLAGGVPIASGQTIYDPAISNTVIDQEQARFDPVARVDNVFDRRETPVAEFDLAAPPRVRITGFRRDTYNLDAELSKTMLTGGTASVLLTDRLSRFTPGLFPLNPESRYDVTLSLTQPLLQGAGVQANVAPIVIARINTERSYYQFKAAMQNLVRSVVDAYWAVVFARTDVWAREQQVEQAKEAFERADARWKKGFGSAGEVAQTRSAFANFKANLIAAQANLMQREAALRNLLGLPPSDNCRLVPVTPPSVNRIDVNWQEIVRLAEDNRPDLIELKLLIEGDQQFLIQAQNQALPKADLISFYRWNGLNGTTPNGMSITTQGGEYTDWTLGVNFSVPLGRRGARAVLRQQELILARDHANLDQGLHNAAHDLAFNVRDLAQFYEQYKSFKEAREAARINVDQQMAGYRSGRGIFLNALQAITDWGNAVSAEAQSLAQYNTQLANLERATGTILETHGVQFYEERFAPRTPLCCCRPSYPASVPPTGNVERYPRMSEPAESIFELQSPILLGKPR